MNCLPDFVKVILVARAATLIRHAVIAAILALSFGVGSAFAQGAIIGQVTFEGGEPLPGVNVFVAGTTLGAATDVDGSYRIPRVPAGLHTVRASAIGFITRSAEVRVESGAEVRLDFELQEATIQGDEVVVTASRREQLSSRVPASVSSLGAEELQARNNVSLDDALQQMSGVQMAGNQVNIRGSSGFSYNTGSRVLLLVDGLPMLRPDADGIPFDALPMNQVDRIEVLKGPGSALYGGGALGGVVNVITKDYPTRPETFVDAHAGFYEPVRYDTWRSRWNGADTPRPMGGISAGHARRFGNGGGFWINFSYRGDASHLRLDESRQMQAHAKVGLPIGHLTRFSLLTGITRRTSDGFLFWNGARDALNPGVLDIGRSAPGTGASDNLVNEMSLHPSLTRLFGGDFLLAIRGRVFGVLIQPLDDEGNPRPVSAGTAGFRYGGEIQMSYSHEDSRFITAGITGDANATRSSFFEEDIPLSQPEGAAFVQWEESILNRLDVGAGARLDLYRIRAGLIERKLSPKLSAAYILADGFVLRGAFGDGFRVPSVAERFVSNSDYLPIVTNIEVRPEISRSYEIGARSYSSIAGWSVVLDGAFFWNDYRRLVEPVFIPRERAFQFVNLTRARIRGTEFNVEASAPDGRVRLQTGYTYLDARDLALNEPLVFRSEHLLKTSGTWRPGIFEAGFDLRLASRPRRVDSDFALFVKDADRMVATRVLDLRLGINWRGLRATIHVKNALDYYYLERPALLAPPRHFTVQTALRF